LKGLSAILCEQVEQAIEILKKDGVVAYPTDTVYGLGASIASAKGVERVYVVKSRPREMAFPLLVASVEQMDSLAGGVAPAARCLIEAFLPGALTLVFKAASSVPGYLKTKEGTVALRIPAHPVPIALIEGVGAPIVGTSANLSGCPSTLTAEEVGSQLNGRADLIIDGGRCPGTESTIVDVTGVVPVILRAGAISKAEIEKACGRVLLGKS